MNERNDIMNAVGFKSEVINDLNRNLNIYFNNIENALLSEKEELARILNFSDWDSPMREKFKDSANVMQNNYDTIEEKFKKVKEYLEFIYHYYKTSEGLAEMTSDNISDAARGLNELFR